MQTDSTVVMKGNKFEDNIFKWFDKMKHSDYLQIEIKSKSASGSFLM